MAQEVAAVDLRALGLAPGAATRMRVAAPPVELRIGGQDYRTDPPEPEVDLEVSRSYAGVHLRLRTAVDLVGPCMRCMEEARVRLDIDADEFVADGRVGDEEFDEDLDSAYVEADRLDLGGWVRDAIAEVVPVTILCREDCAGLCPTCGANLNETHCDCVVEETDSRWDALKGLADRLGDADTG